MCISKIILHNFRGFKGDHEFFFDSGINFFVGNNNCGKSTLFHAIRFLLGGRDEAEYITKNLPDSDDNYVSVEIELSGNNIAELLEREDLKKYQDYLIIEKINDEDEIQKLRIFRSSEERKIVQARKEKTLSIKQVCMFNPATEQFENPTGFDTAITALFDAQFVDADMPSEDVLNFSKTKICGRIIEKVVLGQIKNCWDEFKESHTKTFDKITEKLTPIEDALKNTLTEQYGEAEVNFHFTLPQISDFLKSGNIELTDNGILTNSSEKGTGTQRSLAMALIQVYAEMSSSDDDELVKPILFS